MHTPHPAPEFFSYPATTPHLPFGSRITIFARHGPSVGEERWFYRSDQEWTAIAERLKLTPCPHCKVVGTLIRHGLFARL